MTLFNRLSIRTRLQNDPYYRLQSAGEIAVAAELGIKIDVNQASVDDWLRLPGISIHQARSLVELTHAGVPFYCLEDIAAALGTPVHRLKPLEPVLSFCYYDDTHTVGRVNPNTASVEQLTQIPGVELSLALAVVQNRLAAGSYRNLVDFQQRLSLPGQLTAKLMYYLRFTNC
jgi:DNA uptake protein ComE-like DNA-binding protein